MAALLSTTPSDRHIIGDLSIRFYTLSGANGDTLTVSGISSIQQVVITPTTAVDMGCTVAGNVITFVTGGAWAAKISVISRVG